jgi:hypothetical protein
MASPQVTDTRPSLDPVVQARRGSLLVAAGGALGAITWWLRTAGARPVERYLPFLLILAAGYVAITGIEKLFVAWRALGAQAGTARQPHLRRAVGVGAVVLVLALGGVTAAVVGRAPYWRAVRGLQAGDEATNTLRSLAERHAAALQSSGSGQAAVESWRSTATQALHLKERFAGSLESARYLAREAAGSVKQRADEDAAFYGFCMEWMALYEQVLQETDGVSIVEPSPEWDLRQQAIVEKIQQLPSARSSR